MQRDSTVKLANLSMLELVATQLGNVRHEVVFLGGCTTGLFISDPQFPDVRYTFDVDVSWMSSL
jgi:hypothetical protein